MSAPTVARISAIAEGHSEPLIMLIVTRADLYQFAPKMAEACGYTPEVALQDDKLVLTGWVRDATDEVIEQEFVRAGKTVTSWERLVDSPSQHPKEI